MNNEWSFRRGKTADAKQHLNKSFQLPGELASSPDLNYAFNLPYILISGSYKDNDDNDILCKMLGSYLSKYYVGVVSGAGKSGLMVSDSLCESLSADGRYDPDRIVFYLRKKEKGAKAYVDRVGTVKFYGTHSLELRQKMISKAMAVIVIGGKSGTKQEEQLANLHNIKIIPIARTGGVAYDIWEKQKRKHTSNYPLVKQLEDDTFNDLNSKNIHVAVKATISLLKAFSWLTKNQH